MPTQSIRTERTEYQILSDSKNLAQTSIDSYLSYESIVFKIANTDTKQKYIVLFTRNKHLLEYLAAHGYIQGNSLTSRLLAHLGQKFQKTLPSVDHEILSDLQKKIIALRDLEREIPFDNLSKQIIFKKQLAELIHQAIYKNKITYKSLIPNPLHFSLISAIDLIFGYQFPVHTLMKDQNKFTLSDQISYLETYDINTSNKPFLLQIDGSDYESLKFFTVLNNFSGISDSSHKIRKSIITKLTAAKPPRSRYNISSFLNYISRYKLRSLLFILLILLEIYFLPLIAPILQSYYFLSLLGLGNKFVILGFAIPGTISLINFIFDLPNTFMDHCYKIINFLTKETKLDQNHTEEKVSVDLTQEHSFAQKLYQKFLENHNTLNIDAIYEQPSTNLLWRVPFLRSVIQYLYKEYQKYCNWYFSYIQRNPIGFFIYIIIRSIALFTKSIWLMSGTLFGIEQAADRALSTNRPVFDALPVKDTIYHKVHTGQYALLIKNIHGKYLCYKYIANTPTLIRTYTSTEVEKFSDRKKVNINTIAVPIDQIKIPSLKERLATKYSINFLRVLFKQIFIDFIKIFVIIFPASMVYILINKIIISSIYLIIFLLCNLGLRLSKLFTLPQLVDKFINLENFIYKYYCSLYYKIFIYFSFFTNYIDKIDSLEFKTSEMIAVLNGQVVPKLSCLKDKDLVLYTRAKEIEAYLTAYKEKTIDSNQIIGLDKIVLKAKDLLLTFYKHSSQHHENLKIIENYLAILNYYRENKIAFSRPSDHRSLYIFSVFKVLSDSYLITHPNLTLTLQIKQILHDSIAVKTDFTALVKLLYTFVQSPSVFPEIKAAVLKPTLDQLTNIYNQEVVTLMTFLATATPDNSATPSTTVLRTRSITI